MFDVKEIFETEFKGTPLLNSFVPTGVYAVNTRPTNYLDYFEYFKKTPEVISLVNALITDVISDGYVLKGSKVRVQKAQEFLENNNFDSLIEEWLLDGFVTGNGYLWKGKVSESMIFEEADKVVEDFNFYNKKQARNEILMHMMDEEAFGVKKLGVVPSTTMNVIPDDKYGTTLTYKQEVKGNTEIFSQEEIIHFKLINMNGELYGFTPMESIVSEITMLSVLKDYTGNFFANNGSPDMIFVLPKEIAGSKNHQNLINTLKEYKKIENKHGNLVFTGEISTQILNKFDKDMEFKSLAEYITKVIAMVWRVPPSIYGGEGGAVNSGLSNQAYYRNISHLQSRIEYLLNTQLFKEFKVKFEFNRSYKEDEVREVQIEKIKTDVVEQRMKLGLWSKEAAAEYLHIDSDDFGEERMDKTGLLNQEQLNNMQMLTDAPQQNLNLNKNPDKLN